LTTKLNLEMGNSAEILAIALRVRPEEVCLVPENRQEITTEGGLDAAGQIHLLQPTLDQLHAAKIRVSLFIEPALKQIDAARQLGADMVELHTGAFANAQGQAAVDELHRLKLAAEHAAQLGLQVNAGHGINYVNIREVLSVPHLAELNIGHSIVSRAVFTGLAPAVAEMLAAMKASQRL
jgi:pyridoxine 5-phosphate synthase